MGLRLLTSLAVTGWVLVGVGIFLGVDSTCGDYIVVGAGPAAAVASLAAFIDWCCEREG